MTHLVFDEYPVIGGQFYEIIDILKKILRIYVFIHQNNAWIKSTLNCWMSVPLRDEKEVKVFAIVPP